MLALRLPDLVEVLPAEFQAGLHRFRAAGNEIDAFDTRGRLLDEHLGQPFGGLVGEKGGVGVRDLVQLLLDGRNNRRVVVAQARYGRSSGGVQVTFAFSVDHIRAVPACRERQLGPGMSMQNFAHSGYSRK